MTVEGEKVVTDLTSLAAEALRDEQVRKMGYESWRDAIRATRSSTIKDVGTSFGVDPKTITRWRRTYGLLPPEPEMILPPGYTSLSSVLRATSHMRIKDVADLLGMSRKKVGGLRSAMGVKTHKNNPPEREHQRNFEARAIAAGYLNFAAAIEQTAHMIPAEAARTLGVHQNTITKHREDVLGTDPERQVTERMNRQAIAAGYLSWKDGIRATYHDPVEQAADALDVSVEKVARWRKWAVPSSHRERSLLSIGLAKSLIQRGWSRVMLIERGGLHDKTVYTLLSQNPPDQVSAGTSERLESLMWCPLPRPVKYRASAVVRVSVEESAPEVKQMCSHISQTALSRLAGMGQYRISEILSGQARTLSSDERDRIHSVYVSGTWRKNAG